jgi:hypothetical protein
MLSEKRGLQIDRVYRHVHFPHVHECLYPALEYCWGYRSITVARTEIQDLECRMCLERIADGAERFVAHPDATTQTQVNKAFVFS